MTDADAGRIEEQMRIFAKELTELRRFIEELQKMLREYKEKKHG
ncbi:hypothetical protein [Treponema primitia]